MAPLALIACGLALYLVVTSTLSDAGGGATSNRAEEAIGSDGRESSAADRRRARPRPRRIYTVKPGDTASIIAERTGVSIETIERLNPRIEPRLLSPGDRLKLRP
jgi:LysM repeat protein